MDDKPAMHVSDGCHRCLLCVFEVYDRPGAIQHLTDQHHAKEWLMDPEGYIWIDSGIPVVLRRVGAI